MEEQEKKGRKKRTVKEKKTVTKEEKEIGKELKVEEPKDEPVRQESVKSEELRQEKEKKEPSIFELPSSKEEERRKVEKKQKLVVITGACGFIGSWAVEIAKSMGFRVRACDLPSAFKGKDEFGKSRFPEIVKKTADEIAECDLTQPETLRGVFSDADYILHIAAILKYDVPWETLYKVNVEGTKNIFEEILRSENSSLKRVVVWSTNGIYALPEDDGVISEESLVAPPTKYALSKFLEEKTAMQYYKKFKIPVTIIRPTAVYGPRESYMFLSSLRNFKRLKFLAIPSNFNFSFPTVHAVDVCRAALHLAQLPQAEGEDYIINDDSNMTAIDVMRFAAELFDKPFYLLPPMPVELVRGGIIGLSFLLEKILKVRSGLEFEFSFMFGYDMKYSTRKLKSTGFEFRYPKFDEEMRETVKWYEQMGLL